MYSHELIFCWVPLNLHSYIIITDKVGLTSAERSDIDRYNNLEHEVKTFPVPCLLTIQF